MKWIGGRLPTGWSIERRQGQGERALRICAPDGRSADLRLRSRLRVSPRDVANLVGRPEDLGAEVLVVAPFLGPRTRELLSLASVSYVDTTGNMRIVVGDPAVFLEGAGEDRDPSRQARTLRSLKGAAAGRVVRALCDLAPPYGVRALAQIASSPLGTVSRVVSLLEEEALIVRDMRKQVATVDWPALILRWAKDYSVRTTNRMVPYLEPRGLPALTSKLVGLERYAITGSLAGPDIAPARLAMVYVEDAESAGDILGLVPAETGSNVWLLEPFDDVVFERTRPLTIGGGDQADILVAASPTQVAVDLLTSPGRGPQEGEALIERMKASEHDWRHCPGS